MKAKFLFNNKDKWKNDQIEISKVSRESKYLNTNDQMARFVLLITILSSILCFFFIPSFGLGILIIVATSLLSAFFGANYLSSHSYHIAFTLPTSFGKVTVKEGKYLISEKIVTDNDILKILSPIVKEAFNEVLLDCQEQITQNEKKEEVKFDQEKSEDQKEKEELLKQMNEFKIRKETEKLLKNAGVDNNSESIDEIIELVNNIAKDKQKLKTLQKIK